MTKQKNFSYLINEFNEFVKINSNYNLYIFGSGEEEKNLRSQIIKKKLEKNFSDGLFNKNKPIYEKS